MRKYIIGLNFFVLFLLMTNSGFSAVYFVDYRDGSDGNNGLSDGAPKKTVPTNLVGGDIVYLKRGVNYNQDLTVANSGTERISGTNASINSTGLVLTATGANFQSNGVTTSDKIYINGEGLFGIASVNSQTQLTLSSATLHKSLSNVAYSITNPITLTIKTTWGTGPAKITGELNLVNQSNILVDGVVSRGIEITGTTEKYGVNAWNTGTYKNIFLRYLYIHHTGTYSWKHPGIALVGAVNYALIEHCEVKYVGVCNQTSPLLVGTARSHGIYVSSGDYTTISNNDVQYNNTDGIQVGGNTDTYIQLNTFANQYCSGVHPDGIQVVGSSGPVVIRYNRIFNNVQNLFAGESGYNLNVYGNLFYYSTSVGQAANVTFAENGCGQFYNNIVQGGQYWGLRIREADADNAGACSPNIVKNNIFYENDYSTGGGPEVTVRNTTGAQLDYNIYIRKTKPVTGDQFVQWGTTKYTLAQMRSLFGQEIHGKQCTAAQCDWTWQNPYVFVNENLSNPDFHPAAENSPQVGAGTDVGLQISLDKLLWGSPPNIGAYSSGTGSLYIPLIGSMQPNPPSDLIIR